jgi:D-glycero-D-manno-heptose 1,7-bisphosphate phosphatase
MAAGGRGTRLRPLTDDRPKSMVEAGGRPFLAHVIDLLADQGFEELVLLLGYRADVIEAYLRAHPRHDLRILTIPSDPDDETSQRMLGARDALDEHFLFLYSDNYWPLQMSRLWADYERHGTPAIVTVYRNADGYTRSNVRLSNGLVTAYDPTRSQPGLAGVEIGYAILPRGVLDRIHTTDLPFEKATYPSLIADHALAGHLTDHRYYSVGTLERLALTEAFFSGRETLILDRDGVLNVRPPRAEYISRPEEVVWLPGAIEALQSLAAAGYRFVVVSNQAGIARGAMTFEDLDQVEARMRSDLARVGVTIDRWYYCPHGWDEGCECRKPRPGMLFQAQRDLHLDLTRTLFVGDDDRDGQAADAAGCRFAQVGEARSFLDIARELVPEVTAA